MTASDLEHFTGTETYYHLPFLKDYNYTDGVRYLAQQAKAYWLIQSIFCWQDQGVIKNNPDLERLQIWILKAERDNNTAVLSCYRDTNDLIVSQGFSRINFPLEEVKLTSVGIFCFYPASIKSALAS